MRYEVTTEHGTATAPTLTGAMWLARAVATAPHAYATDAVVYECPASGPRVLDVVTAPDGRRTLGGAWGSEALTREAAGRLRGPYEVRVGDDPVGHRRASLGAAVLMALAVARSTRRGAVVRQGGRAAHCALAAREAVTLDLDLPPEQREPVQALCALLGVPCAMGLATYPPAPEHMRAELLARAEAFWAASVPREVSVLVEQERERLAQLDPVALLEEWER